MLKHAGLLLFAGLTPPQFSSGPVTGTDAEQPARAAIKTSLVQPLSASAGVRSAGLACFPSGSLHVADFVASAPAFQAAVEEAFLNRLQGGRSGSQPEVSVTLKSIDAHLCARGYGVFGTGNKRSMSGEAKFAFDWTYQVHGGNLRMGSSLVTIKLKKAEAQPVEMMLPLALGRLADQFLPPPEPAS